ncbi:MAG: carboxy terminal-processing peptidase [Chromatiales bacterium]|jgi:carboxyl-terminal processing protease
MRKLLFLFASLLISLGVRAKVTEVPLEELVPTQEQRNASVLVTQVMNRFHYLHKEIDDDTSSLMFDRFIETLDPNRHFFTFEDIESFNRFRYRLDDALKNAKPDVAFSIFKIFRERVEERITGAMQLLERDFDFSLEESYRFDREDAPWAENRAELDDIWRKRVKNDVLTLRLSKKEPAEIRKTLRKRYEGILRRTKQLHSDDVFQMFLNAYTLVVEPHTGYMSAHAAENFDINMRLSLEGIGAVLSSDNEYTKVQSVVAGGPAEKSGQIKSGDKITGVAQGIDGEMQDVIGWSLQDVVEQIRGAKGSIVRLLVLGKNSGNDAPAREVIIIRDKIKLEDQAAKSHIIENIKGLDGLRIGVIEVPAFYRDFEAQINGDKDFRSTTRDVKKLLAELVKQNIDGIVVDLRDNGGGSLSEATELTGLFIEEGPVVQVRESDGSVKVEKDEDPKQYYSGPLAVLVNRNSASASEIFAGAIQDYHRGIIIGEPTFGKGTVQTLLDLAGMIKSEENLGRLRLTMAQFFRINGGSTQHKGVVPDIVFPTAKSITDHGERALDHALPWASIKPVAHELRDFVTINGLEENHAQRIQRDPGFVFLQQQEELLQEVRDEEIVSLNEKERQASWDMREKKRLDTRNRFRQARGLSPLSSGSSDEATDKADEQDEEGVKQIMLHESARVLADYIQLSKPTLASNPVLN